MPTVTINTDESNYLYHRYYKVSKTWGYTNWSAKIYISSQIISNAVQRRVKPNPLTDTALAKQSTMRQKPSRILWYDAIVENNASNTAYARFVYNLTKYTDAATEPAWQSRILDKIGDSKVNLASSVAEYRQSGRMFLQFAEAMHTGYQALRGKASRHREITPCTIAAADLAYAFGVQPLAEDVFSSIEELRLKLGGNQIFNFQQLTTNYTDVSKPNYTVNAYGLYMVAINVRTLKSDYLKVKVSLKPDQRSFSFGNPASWAWELIPYSFVVDWGFGVGSYLERLDTLLSVASIQGTRTRREVYAHYGKLRQTVVGGGYVYGSLHHYAYKSHQRFLQNAIPLPPLPKWNPSPTWTKVRRGLALLAVAESGRKVPDLITDPYTFHRNNLCGGAVKRPRKTKRQRRSG